MAKITVHAGDFAPGLAWYYPARDRYVLRANDNQPQQFRSEDVSAAEPASPQAIRMLGGGEARLRRWLMCLSTYQPLTASAPSLRSSGTGDCCSPRPTPDTCAQICAERGARPDVVNGATLLRSPS